MPESRQLRKLRRRSRRLVRQVMRDLRSDSVLRLDYGVEFLRRGRKLSVERIHGLAVYWIAAGGHIESSSVRSQRAELTSKETANVGFHVCDLEDMLTDRTHWAKLRKIAFQQLRESLVQKIRALHEAAAVTGEQHQTARFAVWHRDLHMKSWLEQDNWYFHIIVKVPAGGFVWSDGKKPVAV